MMPDPAKPGLYFIKVAGDDREHLAEWRPGPGIQWRTVGGRIDGDCPVTATVESWDGPLIRPSDLKAN